MPATRQASSSPHHRELPVYRMMRTPSNLSTAASTLRAMVFRRTLMQCTTLRERGPLVRVATRQSAGDSTHRATSATAGRAPRTIRWSSCTVKVMMESVSSVKQPIGSETLEALTCVNGSRSVSSTWR